MPLQLLRALGARVLVSIHPEGEGPLRCWHWSGGNEADTLEWVREQNAGRNVYYHVNAFDFGGAPRRASKEDVARARWLHVDVDARAGEDLAAEVERIRALLLGFKPEPTFVVLSGGGCNALWALDREVDAGAAERMNAWLAAQLGGDACGNRDRVLRLPGTTNWPSAKKRARGRVAAEARVALASGAVHSPEAFGQGAPAAAPGGRDASGAWIGGDAAPVADMDDPRLARVPPWAKAIVVQGDNADKPFASRSEAVFTACCAMLRYGVDAATTLRVITDPGFRISASVLDKGRGTDRYARRQVARAVEAVGAEADFVRGAKEPHPILADVYENVAVAARALGVGLAFNEFTGRCEVEGLEGFGPELGEDATVRLHALVQKAFSFTPRIEMFFRAVRDEALRRKYHPVRDWLASLAWDGVPRLDRWLVDWCGAEDTAFNRAAGALCLVAACRRVREPGAKFDTMLVLEGPPGVGKSSVVRALCPRGEWFTDQVALDGRGKDMMEAVSGKWLVEVSEMISVKDARAMEAVKANLSRQVDTDRLAYRRDVEARPRQCVFVGTTNDERYLSDPTGNRRFWPVRVGRIDLARAGAEAGLVWAEASAREAAGVSLTLPEELWPAAAEAQEARVEEDQLALDLAAFAEVEGWVARSGPYEALGIPPERRASKALQKRVCEAMRKMGWEDGQGRAADGAKVRVWRRGDLAGPMPELEVTCSRDEATGMVTCVRVGPRVL